MALDENVLKELFEGFDAKLVSDDMKEKVKSMIDSLVESRVAALTTELAEKEAYFLEQATKLKKQYSDKEKKLTAQLESKQKILEDEAQSFADKVAKTLAEKEAIMVEESENYRKHVESVVAEEAKGYRDLLESIIVEEAGAYRGYVESIALEEASSYKKQQEAALAQEVGDFKSSMVDSITEFLESELEKNIPAEIMEAAVKVAAYEPLVEGIIGTFGESYIKLDTTSYDVIKEARKENEELSESVNAKVKDNVRLQTTVKELEKKLKIAELTEGMTEKQKAKANKLMESCSSANEVVSEFKKVQDLIIESSVREDQTKVESNKTVPKKPAVKQNLSETAQKKIDKIKNTSSLNESVDPEMAEYAARLNRQLRNG
jgi:DNA anti-recombination protein RmuC